MTTVVQDLYRRIQLPALEGMIADETPSSVATRLCETAAGIPFGIAVSQGTADKGAIIGGSAFVGLTVRDITQAGAPLDPLNASGWGTPDIYPYRANMGVMTRGHMWVKAHAIVAPNGAVFFEATTGRLGGAIGGLSSQGKITFTQQPAPDSTITIDTVEGAGGDSTLTFKASGATGLESNIGPTLVDTLIAAAAVLNASADANITRMTYYADGNELHYAAEAVGAGGDAYVVTTNVTGATVTAMAGGLADAVEIAGARWLTRATAGQLAKVSLG